MANKKAGIACCTAVHYGQNKFEQGQVLPLVCTNGIKCKKANSSDFDWLQAKTSMIFAWHQSSELDI